MRWGIRMPVQKNTDVSKVVFHPLSTGKYTTNGTTYFRSWSISSPRGAAPARWSRPRSRKWPRPTKTSSSSRCQNLPIFGRRSLGLFSPGAGGGWVRTLELRITSICSTREPLLGGKANTREYLRGKYHCTVDLLFDWFGFVCFANKNKNFQ